MLGAVSDTKGFQVEGNKGLQQKNNFYDSYHKYTGKNEKEFDTHIKDLSETDVKNTFSDEDVIAGDNVIAKINEKTIPSSLIPIGDSGNSVMFIDLPKESSPGKVKDYIADMCATKNKDIAVVIMRYFDNKRGYWRVSYSRYNQALTKSINLNEALRSLTTQADDLYGVPGKGGINEIKEELWTKIQKQFAEKVNSEFEKLPSAEKKDLTPPIIQPSSPAIIPPTLASPNKAPELPQSSSAAAEKTTLPPPQSRPKTKAPPVEVPIRKVTPDSKAVALYEGKAIYTSMPTSVADAYKILGLQKNASYAEIRAAHGKMSFEMQQTTSSLSKTLANKINQQNINVAKDLIVGEKFPNKATRVQINTAENFRKAQAVDKAGMNDILKTKAKGILIVYGMIMVFNAAGKLIECHQKGDYEGFVEDLIKDAAKTGGGLAVFVASHEAATKGIQYFAGKSGIQYLKQFAQYSKASGASLPVVGGLIAGGHSVYSHWDQLNSGDREKWAASATDVMWDTATGAISIAAFSWFSGLAASALAGGPAAPVTVIIYVGGTIVAYAVGKTITLVKDTVYEATGKYEGDIAFEIEKEVTIDGHPLIQVEEGEFSTNYRVAFRKTYKERSNVNMVKGYLQQTAVRELLTERFNNIAVPSPYSLTPSLINFLAAGEALIRSQEKSSTGVSAYDITKKKLNVKVKLHDVPEYSKDKNGRLKQHPTYTVTYYDGDKIVESYKFVDTSINFNPVNYGELLTPE
ncbi:hypothetical protein KJ742_03105, partial [Patescibacteria group bacterium]|nr:hypothetical protein [Patescibacteria group bacterium]